MSPERHRLISNDQLSRNTSTPQHPCYRGGSLKTVNGLRIDDARVSDGDSHQRQWIVGRRHRCRSRMLDGRAQTLKPEKSRGVEPGQLDEGASKYSDSTPQADMSRPRRQSRCRNHVRFGSHERTLVQSPETSGQISRNRSVSVANREGVQQPVARFDEQEVLEMTST